MTSSEAKGTTEEGGQVQGEVGVEKERSLSHPPLRPPQSQTSLSSTSRPPLPILVIPQSSLSVPPRLRQPQPQQEEEESAEFASSPAELSPPASESKFLSPSPIPSLTLTESYGPPSPTASTLSEDSKSTVFHPTTSLALRGNEVEKKSHGRKLSVNTLGSVGETEEEDVERLEEGRKGEREGDGDRLDEKEQRRENTTSPSAFTASSGAPSSTSRLSRVPLIGRFFTPKDDDGIPLPATSGKGGSSSSSDENAEGDGEGKKKKKKEKEVPDKAELIADPPDEGMAPFSPSVKPSLLNALVDPKSFENLEALGRTDGLLASLGVVDGQGLDVAFEATLQRSATRMSGLSVDKKEKEKEKIEKKKEVSEKAPSGAVAGAFGGGGGGEGGKYPVTRATYDDRRRVFGENRIPSKKTKTLLELMWMAFTDKVLILLSVAAVVSLALGLYQDLGTPPDRYFGPGCDPEVGCKQPQVDWVEGLAIMIAILIVVVVGSVNDYQKERQFQKLNSIKEARFVKVIRQGGQEQQISVYDVVVGDILLLEPGEIIPVDGVFLSGHNVKCDESGATGEPDLIKKCTYEEAMKKQEAGKLGAHEDCFLLSGSKVAEGYGRYLCIAVGTRSFNGRIMMSLQRPAETTPLQNKLNHLAQTIAKLGSAAGGLLFFVLMIRFFIQLGTHSDRSADDKAQNFIQILIIAVTVIVVAVPEGLPLAVTLSLAFATRRMTKMNLLVRVLGSCETMGHCTVTCTDKTGTLTQNKMMVVAGSVGVHLKFADNLEETRRTNANDDVDIDPENPPSRASSSYDEAITPVTPRVGRKDFSIDLKDLDSRLSPALKSLINESIAINSTAFEGEDERTGEMTFIGSKTEVALLTMARNLGWPKYKEVREKAEIVQMIPFSSERKCMGVVVKLPDGKHRLYLKGASEVLAKLCLRHVHVDELPDVSTTNISDIRLIALNDETRGNINRTIIYYANQSLRTIALCYRDLPQWPIGSAKAREANGGEVPFSELVRDLTLIGITAIEDPLRPGVTEAVAICQKAGVAVKMCTGDNILTARSIATQCGIYSAGGIIMEGPVFRKLSPQDMNEVVPRLQVLARSSPEDKERLVNHLKGMGEIVGVTGDGTNDGPALKTANVGFSMGIAGTEVAKEASDIILMDDNFASIVSAIMWGRCVNDSVRKFIQFQISVNIVAVVVTFVSAVASSDEQSVLTAVQLLWVNLIMDTFAALALATDPATPVVLKRKPDKASDPLISVDMWKMIVGQATYQTICALVLHFAGKAIFGYTATGHEGDVEQDKIGTLVFNVFVFSQIFNQLNCRRLDRQFNIFEGFWKNYYFLLIFAIMVGGQTLIVIKGGAAFQVVSMSGRDWGISIGLGALSLPIGVLIRIIPTEPIHKFLIKMRLFPDPNALPTVSPLREGEEWNEGITKVIDNLSTFGQIRGGRMRSSSIVMKSRSAMLKEKDIHPGSLMAMVPSLVMSSVGAGWKPSNTGGSLADPAGADPSKSSAQLFKTGIQVHPDTDENDPLVRKFGIIVPPSPSSRSHSRQNSLASKNSKNDGLSSPATPSPSTTLSPHSARTPQFSQSLLSPTSAGASPRR